MLRDLKTRLASTFTSPNKGVAVAEPGENHRQWWRQPRWWVVLSIIVVGAYFIAVNLFRHLNLLTAQFDLGNMDQVLWQSLHGRWFVLTDPISGIHQVRTAIHADFLLLIYLPFYALWPDPRTMLILQVVAVVSGAFPLFWLARKYLTERLAAFLSISYLVYPSLTWAVTFDVHAVVLVAPLFLWAAWSASERRWWWYAITLALALLGKEEVGAAVALGGVFMMFWRRPRWIGAVTAVVGFGWTTLMLGYAIPHAREMPGHFALAYYAAFGGTTGEIAKNILLRPWIVLRDVFSSAGLHYQLNILLPLGGVSLLGLPVLLIGTPSLLINLLSTNGNLRTIFFQYTAVLIPIVFLSAVLGLVWLRRLLNPHPKLWRWAMCLIIIANTASVLRWADLPGTWHTPDSVRPFQTSSYRQGIQAIRRLVNPADRLATTNNVAPHFTQREYAWAFPKNLDRADGLVVLLGSDFDVVPKDEVDRTVMALQQDPRWMLAYHDRDLYYFRRGL